MRLAGSRLRIQSWRAPTPVGGENPVLPGNFVAPHGIWADKRGDLYVGEVVVNAGAVKRMAPLKPAAFQKFRKRAG
jgi:hypothetical protein